MKQFLLRLLPMLLFCGGLLPASYAAGREYLTSQEIEKIQDNQGIDFRVKLYLEFAALRLKIAEDKLNGVEFPAGDPFELITPEEVLDAYYHILRSTMINVDDANQNPNPRNVPKVQLALKTLKTATEKALVQLGILKRIAEEKKKEELWNLVNKAIDVTNGAHEGAESGITKDADAKAKKAKRK
jgi:hypothetical protein